MILTFFINKLISGLYGFIKNLFKNFNSKIYLKIVSFSIVNI